MMRSVNSSVTSPSHVYYSRKLERISASMEVLLTELVSFRCHHSQR